jgi:hypothetical protein
MLAIEGNVAQSTDKSAAGRTGNHGFFTGMIKTSGFFIQLEALASLALRQFAKKGGIHVRPQLTRAGRTGNQGAGIKILTGQGCVTLGAAQHRIFSSDFVIFL